MCKVWNSGDIPFAYMRFCGENIVHASFIGISVHGTITECDITCKANEYNEAK